MEIEKHMANETRVFVLLSLLLLNLAYFIACTSKLKSKWLLLVMLLLFDARNLLE